MKYLLSILCLFVLSCDSAPEFPPSNEQVASIRTELDILNNCDESGNNCRFNNRTSAWYEYDKETRTIILSIVAQLLANDNAIGVYIKELKSIHKGITPEYNLKARAFRTDSQDNVTLIKEVKVKGRKPYESPFKDPSFKKEPETTKIISHTTQ